MGGSYSIAIVAHRSRARQVHELSARIGPEAVVWDELGQGCEHTHLRAWRWLTDSPGDWKVVVEDDAVPVPGFVDQLTKVLRVAPASVISLYLGRGRPPHWQQSIGLAIRYPMAWRYEDDPNFLTCGYLLHGVGYAIRAELVTDMIKYVKGKLVREPGVPFDEAVSAWALHRCTQVAYCRPSLLDHRDDLPTIGKRADGQPRGKRDAKGRQQRTAWLCDTRAEWMPTTAEIPLPPQLAKRKPRRKRG